MTCGDKLWSLRTFLTSIDDRYGHYAPFCYQDTIVSDGTKRQIMVILSLLSSRGGEPDDMQRQIMIIPHTFCHPKRSCPVARRDKLWLFCSFCNPEAVSPMTCGDKLWSLRTFLSSIGGEPDGMRRQIMVITHTFMPFVDDCV